MIGSVPEMDGHPFTFGDLFCIRAIKIVKRGGKVMVFNASFNNISVIVAVSFIGGGKRSTRRKPPTYRKSLRNFITYCCIAYTSPEWDSKSQHK
jgi:hypothetical protein